MQSLGVHHTGKLDTPASFIPGTERRTRQLGGVETTRVTLHLSDLATIRDSEYEAPSHAQRIK